jgi:hypothetical protein
LTGVPNDVEIAGVPRNLFPVWIFNSFPLSKGKRWRLTMKSMRNGLRFSVSEPDRAVFKEIVRPDRLAEADFPDTISVQDSM